MRLALFSNVTIDFLGEILKKKHDVYFSPGFNSWEQDILNHSSPFYDFNAEAAVILLHAGAAEWKDKDKSQELIDEWILVIKTLAERCPSLPVFVSSIDANVDFCVAGEHIGNFIENGFVRAVDNLHESGYKVYLLPVKSLISDMGRDAFYSKKMWYVGSMPYSFKGLDALGTLIETYISAIKGKKKKCLALDLDNTLWGGVIAEDGVEGISLSNHKEGARYYDAQKLLKRMKEQGVMLAVLSKNNISDVEPVFSHPFMVLQKSDFADYEINWESKAENIVKMAERLNIGLDSFVFLDDNAAEREEMSARHPEVITAPFPKDSSLLPDTIRKIYDDWFLSLEITAEDVKKTDMYRAERARKEMKSSSISVNDYLKKLEMKLVFHRMKEKEENRVVQLINKTNQFNLTTKRYSFEDVISLSRNSDIFTASLIDKYGDEGLIAVLIVKYSEDVATIDSFLMSCRVMGRKVEDEIFSLLKKHCEFNGVNKIKAEYIKTQKNVPVENLFERLGFTVVSSSPERKEYIINADMLPESTGLFAEVRTED